MSRRVRKDLLPPKFKVKPEIKFDLFIPRYEAIDLPNTDPENTQSGSKRYWLYVIRLSKNNIYIGMTGNSNPYNRIQMHFKGIGSRWTKMFKPAEIIELRDIGNVLKWQAEDMENQLMKHYSKKYGKRSVRGGYRTNPGLVIPSKESAKLEIRHKLEFLGISLFWFVLLWLVSKLVI